MLRGRERVLVGVILFVPLSDIPNTLFILSLRSCLFVYVNRLTIGGKKLLFLYRIAYGETKGILAPTKSSKQVFSGLSVLLDENIGRVIVGSEYLFINSVILSIISAELSHMIPVILLCWQ